SSRVLRIVLRHDRGPPHDRRFGKAGEHVRSDPHAAGTWTGLRRRCPIGDSVERRQCAHAGSDRPDCRSPGAAGGHFWDSLALLRASRSYRVAFRERLERPRVLVGALGRRSKMIAAVTRPTFRMGTTVV